jgi:hypothetical protein
MMPNPSQFSPAGQSLFGGLGQIPGLGAGLGDATESEEERRKRLGMVAQQRSLLTPQASPATNSLFGSMTSTGLLR